MKQNIIWVDWKHKPHKWFGTHLMLGYIKRVAVHLWCNFGTQQRRILHADETWYSSP
jgi:hypothetical protein